MYTTKQVRYVGVALQAKLTGQGYSLEFVS